MIAERIGWTHGLTVFKERVAELRPVYLPPRPGGSHDLCCRGDRAVRLGFRRSSCRWGSARSPHGDAAGVDDGDGLLPVAVGDVDPDPPAADLFAGWWQLIEAVGAVPRVLVWDGEGAIGRWRAGRVELTEQCHGFRGTLGARVLVCKPGESKGIVDRANLYLERSFLPGEFASPGASISTGSMAFDRQHATGTSPRWASVDFLDPDRARCWPCRRWRRSGRR